MTMKEGERLEEKKVRVVIELSKNDYEALSTLKNLTNVSWRDIIVAGAIWWSKELNLEEKIERIREHVSKIKNK